MTIELRGSKPYGYEGCRVIDTEKSQRVGGARILTGSLMFDYIVVPENSFCHEEFSNYSDAMGRAREIAEGDAKRYAFKTGQKIVDLTMLMKNDSN